VIDNRKVGRMQWRGGSTYYALLYTMMMMMMMMIIRLLANMDYYGRPLWGADILLCTTPTHVRVVRKLFCYDKCNSLCFQFIKWILSISYLFWTIFCAKIFNIIFLNKCGHEEWTDSCMWPLTISV
jgi:hypothetical protein